jgi:hypothetical protein
MRDGIPPTQGDPRPVLAGVRGRLALEPDTIGATSMTDQTEITSLRSALQAAERRERELREHVLDALDCLPRALCGSRPFSMDQRAEVMLAIETLRKALAATVEAEPSAGQPPQTDCNHVNCSGVADESCECSCHDGPASKTAALRIDQPAPSTARAEGGE